mmetsp:Transcript_130075/g.362407  ORF Transcript_130075/g.362407 Transcript_130075/m.362407 type:complete len:255 (-) Transcript_130075:522-1286(-)
MLPISEPSGELPAAVSPGKSPPKSDWSPSVRPLSGVIALSANGAVLSKACSRGRGSGRGWDSNNSPDSSRGRSSSRGKGPLGMASPTSLGDAGALFSAAALNVSRASALRINCWSFGSRGISGSSPDRNWLHPHEVLSGSSSFSFGCSWKVSTPATAGCSATLRGVPGSSALPGRSASPWPPSSAGMLPGRAYPSGRRPFSRQSLGPSACSGNRLCNGLQPLGWPSPFSSRKKEPPSSRNLNGSRPADDSWIFA